MDHLLPPLGGSGRERETLKAQATGCSAFLFCAHSGQNVTFYFVSSAENFFSEVHFCLLEKSPAVREEKQKLSHLTRTGRTAPSFFGVVLNCYLQQKLIYGIIQPH